jgi:hypothetical protein
MKQAIPQSVCIFRPAAPLLRLPWKDSGEYHDVGLEVNDSSINRLAGRQVSLTALDYCDIPTDASAVEPTKFVHIFDVIENLVTINQVIRDGSKL